MNKPNWRLPSAWLPILCSLSGLGIVVAHWALYGITHEPDEGAAAHIFQILMVVQAAVILYFVVRWIPVAPRRGALILGAQLAAIAAAMASVYLLT